MFAEILLNGDRLLALLEQMLADVDRCWPIDNRYGRKCWLMVESVDCLTKVLADGVGRDSIEHVVRIKNDSSG